MTLDIKENPRASLSYMLFLRRDKLRARADSFKNTVKLTELKLSLTNKLISLNKPQIQRMGFEELGALSRQQIFSKKLKMQLDNSTHEKRREQSKMDEDNESTKESIARTNIVERMYEWRKSSPEEKRRILEKQRRERLAKQQANYEAEVGKQL
ncbi:unnamed protein product [Ceratitis capitata]|uniref:(Mediterranean fruit fly) hypothetical protein n=1 Tax=Ceratitis capitata TaxID=7213 RepID=A0A811UJU7_CERCA|nr:unnamed protein product [Ceratitis capitata]